MEEYHIHKDTIIFNSRFNSPLNEYIDVIKNYKKIFFSNYDDYELCFHTYNKYFLKYKLNYRGSEFNCPLADSLKNLTQLEEIVFGCDFNSSLGDSLENLYQLKILIFGRNFNQPITNLLNNLTMLEKITFGLKFNQELIIPPNVKILSLESNNKVIDYLPNGIEELYLGANFNLKLDDLPSSIKIISFGNKSNYKKKLNNLPKSLEKLILPPKYNNVIKNVNSNCIIDTHKHKNTNKYLFGKKISHCQHIQ